MPGGIYPSTGIALTSYSSQRRIPARYIQSDKDNTLRKEEILHPNCHENLPLGLSEHPDSSIEHPRFSSVHENQNDNTMDVRAKTVQYMSPKGSEIIRPNSVSPTEYCDANNNNNNSNHYMQQSNGHVISAMKMNGFEYSQNPLRIPELNMDHTSHIMSHDSLLPSSEHLDSNNNNTVIPNKVDYPYTELSNKVGNESQQQQQYIMGADSQSIQCQNYNQPLIKAEFADVFPPRSTTSDSSEHERHPMASSIHSSTDKSPTNSESLDVDMSYSEDDKLGGGKGGKKQYWL